jgi:DNA polymerase delta subunit 1
MVHSEDQAFTTSYSSYAQEMSDHDADEDSDEDNNNDEPCTQHIDEDVYDDLNNNNSAASRKSLLFSHYPLLLPPPPHDDDRVEFLVLDVVFSQRRVVLFGREACGASVAFFVSDWYPYVLMEARPDLMDPASLCDLLDDKMADEWTLHVMKEGQRKPRRFVNSVSLLSEKQKSILGFDPSPPKAYWKICVEEPRFLFVLRTCMSSFCLCPQGLEACAGGTQLYNASIDPTLQFMVDVGMMGCEWCCLEAGGSVRMERETTCAIEYHDLLPSDLKFMTGKEDMGRLRVLSFDIEAAGRRGVFPQASHDPVIQIAVHFKVVGMDEQPVPILLSLRSCDAIEGANVFCFEEESELLLAFRDLVMEFDCDVFTGYNICNFDFLYLRDRAVALDCGDEFEKMTKLLRLPLFLRESVFQSVQMGKRKRVRVSIAGRVCLDMLTCIQNNQAYRLDSYKLDSVSEHFLGDHKVDLPFTQITPMWMRDSAARRELGVYCLKDAELPLSLIDKLDSLTQTVEMARCAGIPFDWVLQRGIIIRNSSLLLRRAKDRAFIFPLLPPKESTGKYAGATVLDAVVGIHNHVGVLDFSAMYPSIIRAHNLCYSSYLPPAPAPPPTTIPYEQHNGQRFATSAMIKGLLPEVVEHLQNCRNKAKAAAAAASDPMQKRVNKAREMAFKICNNGMYGSLGSTQSLLPLMEIAQTVTAIGRNDIKNVKAMAEGMFPDAQDVYGDTDSVFIKFAVSDTAMISIPDSIAEVMDKSKAVAKAVNAVMQTPKKIEYEKAYSVMLLLSKKRYAGLKYTEDHVYGKPPPVELKGVQSVRF